MTSVSSSPISVKAADSSSRLTPFPRPPFATTKLCKMSYNNSIEQHQRLTSPETNKSISTLYSMLKLFYLFKFRKRSVGVLLLHFTIYGCPTLIIKGNILLIHFGLCNSLDDSWPTVSEQIVVTSAKDIVSFPVRIHSIYFTFVSRGTVLMPSCFSNVWLALSCFRRTFLSSLLLLTVFTLLMSGSMVRLWNPSGCNKLVFPDGSRLRSNFR